uniref:7TM_GPCR_Srx domain-containing protein n=1 Tax=Parastrongyloides trichosuri TaxID=131310 RepID=A0A0N4ZI79_PARTI
MIVSEFLNVPQQIIHGYSGFYSIFNFTSGETIDKILGGLLQSGYMFSMPLSTILALNRLDVLTRQKYFKSIDRIYIFWSLLGITLLYGIIIFALLNTPYIGLYYGLQDVSWHYLRTEYRLLAKEIEYYTCIIFVLLTFIIYIIIIGFIMKNRLENDESKKSTVIQVSSNPVKISLEQKKSFARKALTFASTKKKIFEKREQSLLIQCVLNFIYIAILEICWYFGDYFLPVTRWRAIGLNYVWICNTGISSLLYLIVLK